MIYRTYTLSNGLRVILKPENSPVTYCGMVVNAGSRDESDDEAGMAHFIEHMLFKGTTHRRAGHIINRLENVGGELNAYTTKEETVVYAGVLNEHFPRAIELIADIVFHSTFRQKEIDKEVVIIVDEIQSYNDSPSELIYDDFEELLFHAHPLAHNILGTAEHLEKYKTEDAFRFVKRQYRPDEMVFFAQGNIDFDHLKRLAEKYLGVFSATENTSKRTAPVSYAPVTREVNKNTHQVHHILGNRAYNMYHPNRMGLYLLNNILGGPGMNSLLNLSLREKHGLVYNVESAYQPFTDTGMWTVYYGCDPENAKKCRQLVLNELQKLQQDTIPEKKLETYKTQLMGQMAIASEIRENNALSVGKSFMRYNKVDELSEIKERIAGVTALQMRDIAAEIFVVDQFTELRYY